MSALGRESQRGASIRFHFRHKYDLVLYCTDCGEGRNFCRCEWEEMIAWHQKHYHHLSGYDLTARYETEWNRKPLNIHPSELQESP